MAEDRLDRGPLETLEAMVNKIKTATLTTLAPDGSLHGRPLLTQSYEPGGVLWFITKYDSSKIEELGRDHRVQVSYSDPEDNSYLCASGTAEVVRDHDKLVELWNPNYAPWFPGGADDPNLALLRVHIDHAEYWNAPRITEPLVAGFVAMSPDSPPGSHGVVEP